MRKLMRIAVKVGIRLVAIFIIWIALPWSSIWWHVWHGNDVMLDGYTVHLPLTWSPDASGSVDGDIYLKKKFSLISVTASNCCTTMELSVLPKPFHEDTFGIELANEWQQALVQNYGRLPETIQARQHLLVCALKDYPRAIVGTEYSLICRVLATKIQATATGSASTVREARAMWTQAF